MFPETRIYVSDRSSAQCPRRHVTLKGRRARSRHRLSELPSRPLLLSGSRPLLPFFRRAAWRQGRLSDNPRASRYWARIFSPRLIFAQRLSSSSSEPVPPPSSGVSSIPPSCPRSDQSALARLEESEGAAPPPINDADRSGVGSGTAWETSCGRGRM
ncbi:hypothetical protein D3C71_1215420 [compost metagenome]